MFNIVFYEDSRGYSELYEFLQELAEKSKTNKDKGIQFKQIILCIELLQKRGKNLPSNYTKHISGDIWELRPGKNRILYFYFKNQTFVLLHCFRKKSQKTPQKEIHKAYKEILDFISRNGGKEQ